MNADRTFFSKIGFAYLTYLIAAILVQIIVINLISAINSGLINSYDALTVLSAVCNYILPFPIFYCLLKRIPSEKPGKYSLNPQRLLTYFAIALTLMWAGNIAGLAVTSAITALTPYEVTNPVHEVINSSDMIINLVLISAVGPVFEELFFRKLLIDRTIVYGAEISVFSSALLFAFFHTNLNQFFYAFLLGGFLAYVYLKTGKVTYTIILHMFVNLMGSVASVYFAESLSRISLQTLNPTDISVIIIYITVVITSLFIGILALSGWRNADLSHIQSEIKLNHPFKTVLLNPGMILFMLFCVTMMVNQVI